MSGQQDLAIGGGVESMSRVPIGSDGVGIDGNNLQLRKKLVQVPQGISADLIATREGVKREELERRGLATALITSTGSSREPPARADHVTTRARPRHGHELSRCLRDHRRS